MTSCCNKHDICYDSCGTDRDECDDEFKQCLDKMCRELKKDLSKKEYQGKDTPYPVRRNARSPGSGQCFTKCVRC